VCNKYTKLLIGVCGGSVVGIFYKSFILLNWDLTLAGAARVIVIHGTADRTDLSGVVLLLVLLVGGNFVL
jgi:hypothetical protein